MNWNEKVKVRLSTETDDDYKDIYGSFGVAMLKGSYEKLLEYPVNKSLIKWDDRRNHGVKYLTDADNMRFSEKNVSISLLLEGDSTNDYYIKYERFIKFIASGLIYIKIISLDRVFKVVYSGISNLKKIGRNYCTFTVKFIEPNPNDRK